MSTKQTYPLTITDHCFFFFSTLFLSFFLSFHHSGTSNNGNEAWAYLYATLCFFGGIAITAVFDAVLHHIQGKIFQHKSSSQQLEKEQQQDSQDQLKVDKCCDSHSKNKTRTASDTSSVTDHANVDIEQPAVHEDDDRIARESSQAAPAGDNNGDQLVGHGGHLIATLYQNQEEPNVHDSRALIHMGIFAGIALAFHVRS